jgi:thiol-disulfide isomerase/thioredoxin
MKTRLFVFLLLTLGTLSAGAASLDEFALPDLQGKLQTLAAYRGKWVIINYWATNCPPCVKEIPELEDFHQRHKDRDAVVVGVNYEDIKLTWLRDFISSVHMTYPVLLADPDKATPFGSIIMLPTTIIVSPEGRLMGQQRGAVTAETLDHYLEQQQHPGKSGQRVRGTESATGAAGSSDRS